MGNGSYNQPTFELHDLKIRRTDKSRMFYLTVWIFIFKTVKSSYKSDNPQAATPHKKHPVLISNVVFGAALVLFIRSTWGKCKLTAYLFKCIPLC